VDSLTFVSLPLALILGFVIHRSGLCMVRTVAENLASHKATRLAGILKSVLWVLTILLVWAFFTTDTSPFNENHTITYFTIIGGFLFGVGAALNGGCAFSTLGHLANGNVWMLTTLVGFSLGIAGMTFAFPNLMSVHIQPSMLTHAPPYLLAILLLLLGLLLILEIYRLWTSRAKNSNFRQLLFSKRYRQSTSSLLIGFGGGVLYLLQGNWTYTFMLKSRIKAIALPHDPFKLIHLYLFFALFLGMVISAMMKKSVVLKLKPTKRWGEYFVGGALMGIGAVLIPGGNDTLILKSMPGLSLHAIPTFFALLCGVAITLRVRRSISGKALKVVCTDDVCRADK